MAAKTTINEIARLAGVNPSTVSRVLNSATAGMISTEQRKKIEAICDKLNYRPQISARSFVTGKTYKIGLISGYLEIDLTQPLFALYVKGLCNQLQANNYTVTLISVNTEEKKREDEILSLLRSKIADGYVLGAILLTEKIKQVLHQSKTPIISLNFHAPYDAEGFSTVIIDDIQAYRDIWYRIPPGMKIAYVGPDSRNTKSKLARVKEAACLNHIDTSSIDEIFFPVKATSFLAGRTNAFEFAVKNIKKLRGYDLLWCPSDFTALGIADALKFAGLKPGKDIFLIGENNIETFPGFTPNPWLSTVFPQLEKAGEVTARLMLEQIASGDASEQRIQVESVYIPRQSFPKTIKPRTKI